MTKMNFEALFQKSNGQPVRVDGTEYCLIKRIQLDRPSLLRIEFVSTRPPFKQGIHIEADNKLAINQISEESFLLWEDTAPQTVECLVPGGEVRMWNVWDTGDGITQSWHNGAAMIVEEKSPTIMLFRCNDGQPNSDCDDLVFRCEINAEHKSS